MQNVARLDPTHSQRVVIVGAGLVGALLAILLKRRGYNVELFEQRSDMRRVDLPAGRSINLVLTNRGLRALELLGLRERVLELTVPVLGRMMHDRGGELAYQPYGKDDSECNYSISRTALNIFLLNVAQHDGVPIHFDHALKQADFETGMMSFSGPDGELELRADVIFGADGAGSKVRRLMAEVIPGFEQDAQLISHGYKELTFAAGPEGSYAMAGHALHIWPRGHHMLMGLANLDGSFTGTLYLPFEGEDSVEQLQTPQAVRAFFEEHYADAIGLMSLPPEVDFFDGPTGKLGTVRCGPWHIKGRALLIGDAAHAIVPFFGQGLNCGFEDCAVLDELLREGLSLEQTFERFYHARKPNAEAIADMALENFIEMSSKVADERFLLRKKIERRIEQELGHLYRSRYATVMYSPIPYSVAFQAGHLQERLLAELMEGINAPDELDLERAKTLIEQRLSPFYAQHQVDLSF